MDELNQSSEPEVVSGWLPRLVVIGMIGGFALLAWYAYKTGTQSYKDEDLMVIEADKSPIKQKPTDPGGMKFPNQDKTVFETFGNNPPTPPKVERVLPPPEEPMPKHFDADGTKTWINEKLHKKPDDKEALIADDASSAKDAAQTKEDAADDTVEDRVPADSESTAAVDAAVENTVEQKLASKDKDDTVSSYTKPQTKSLAELANMKPIRSTDNKNDNKTLASVLANKPTEPAAAAPSPQKQAQTQGSMIQLGAYRSEDEARAQFIKIQKKFPAVVDREPIIAKADIAGKGTYYRLRVGGFGSDAEAKSFCSDLSAQGQACMVAK